MHELAHSYANGISHGFTNGITNGITNGHQANGQLAKGQQADGKARIVLLLANSLDCESLSQVLLRQQGFEILTATSDIDFGLARCRRLYPQVLILDPKVASDGVQRAAEAVRSRGVEHLLVLDDRLHEGRLAAILAMPAVSYFTRQAGLTSLMSAILQIVKSGDRAFDPEVRARIHRATGGLRLQQAPNQPSVTSLTSRELQVMKLLADGHSVRRCAERLDLAESTIDNHKSRLMKKLDIHKVVELTHVAIREGLIVV